MQRLATQNAPDAKKRAENNAVALKTSVRVIGTTWIETARGLPKHTRVLEKADCL
jgi:hypothetical protein